MNVDYKLIGSRIKAQRIKRRLTQEVMAEKLDVTIGYVSQVERGITKISLDLLAKISSILNCDIAELVTNSSVNSEVYMIDEIVNDFRKLSGRDKKIVLSLIRIMLENESNHY